MESVAEAPHICLLLATAHWPLAHFHPAMRAPTPYQKDAITVAEIVQHLRTAVGVEIEPLGKRVGETRTLTESHIHRPGLALAGYTELFASERVQILGNTEIRYLVVAGRGAGG